MNGTDPQCTKTPIRAALEDTVVVFIYTFLAAAGAVLTVDGVTVDAFILPVVMAGMQGMITYARKRDIVLPTPGGDDDEDA